MALAAARNGRVTVASAAPNAQRPAQPLLRLLARESLDPCPLDRLLGRLLRALDVGFKTAGLEFSKDLILLNHIALRHICTLRRPCCICCMCRLQYW